MNKTPKECKRKHNYELKWFYLKEETGWTFLRIFLIFI